MLQEWQIMLLDHGLWLLPLMTVVALGMLPWSDKEINKVANSFNKLIS